MSTDETEIVGIVLTEEHIQRANESWDNAPIVSNRKWQKQYKLWKASGRPRGVGWWEGLTYEEQLAVAEDLPGADQ